MRRSPIRWPSLHSIQRFQAGHLNYVPLKHPLRRNQVLLGRRPHHMLHLPLLQLLPLRRLLRPLLHLPRALKGRVDLVCERRRRERVEVGQLAQERFEAGLLLGPVDL